MLSFKSEIPAPVSIKGLNRFKCRLYNISFSSSMCINLQEIVFRKLFIRVEVVLTVCLYKSLGCKIWWFVLYREVLKIRICLFHSIIAVDGDGKLLER